jgi:O-antigen/teichoic acid export membrane protein
MLWGIQLDNRPLKHGIIMTYSAGVVQIVVNMVFTAVLARCLGSVEYGLYLLLGSVVAYISSFDFGLNNTTSRYVAKYRAEGSKEKESNLISITMLFYCIIAGVILIVGLILRGHLSLFVHDVTPEYMSLANKLFLLLIINIAISLPMHSFSAILIGYEKFVYTRIITIIRIVAVPLLSIPFLLLGKGSLAVVAITTVSNLLAGMANLLNAIKKLHVKIKLLYWNSEFVREIIGYSWFIFLGVSPTRSC